VSRGPSVIAELLVRPVKKSPLRRYTAEKLCLSAMVVRVHDGALAEEHAVLSTTLVIVEDR